MSQYGIHATRSSPHRAVQGFWASFVKSLGFGRQGQLTADSSNIQQLIKDAYDSLAMTVQLVPVDNGTGRALFVNRHVFKSVGQQYCRSKRKHNKMPVHAGCSVEQAITDAKPGSTYNVRVVLEATADTPTNILASSDAENPPLILQGVGLNAVEIKIRARPCDCKLIYTCHACAGSPW